MEKQTEADKIIAEAESQLTDAEETLTPRERVQEIEPPPKLCSFENWREVILRFFPDLLFPAELVLSIVAQILIRDITNPFALVLVDVPSAGKTIVINFFDDIDELTYATDKFTPASFMSNATNVKKKDLPKIDLLPRIQYKMLLIRDLSTVFSKRDDDLNESLGLLTRVLDGEGLKTDSGVHGQRQYVGEYLFMLLAGSTPIAPRVWKIMGNLGSRLFFLNMQSRDKSEAELAEQITSLAHKKKEKICQRATKDFLHTLWNRHPSGVEWNNEKDDIELKKVIARCAKLLARLRGVINVWQENTDDGVKYSYTTPVIEKPDRINQLLYNLTRGHALICGRSQISPQDFKVVLELVTDSAPGSRVRLFRQLLENGGQIRTSEAEESLDCSKPTALKEMEILKILGIGYITQDSSGDVGEPEKILHISSELEWFLSEECQNLRNQ